MDANEIFASSTLPKMVRHFHDPLVGAGTAYISTGCSKLMSAAELMRRPYAKYATRRASVSARAAEASRMACGSEYSAAM